MTGFSLIEAIASWRRSLIEAGDEVVARKELSASQPINRAICSLLPIVGGRQR